MLDFHITEQNQCVKWCGNSVMKFQSAVHSNSLSVGLGKFWNLILYLGRSPLTGSHIFTLAMCLSAHSAEIDLPSIQEKLFIFCQLI